MLCVCGGGKHQRMNKMTAHGEAAEWDMKKVEAMLMDGNHYRNPPFLGVGRRAQPRRKFSHKDKTEQEYWSSAMDTQCPSTLFTYRSLSKALLSRNLAWVVTNPPLTAPLRNGL